MRRDVELQAFETRSKESNACPGSVCLPHCKGQKNQNNKAPTRFQILIFNVGLDHSARNDVVL